MCAESVRGRSTAPLSVGRRFDLWTPLDQCGHGCAAAGAAAAGGGGGHTCRLRVDQWSVVVSAMDAAAAVEAVIDVPVTCGRCNVGQCHCVLTVVSEVIDRSGNRRPLHGRHTCFGSDSTKQQ